MAEDPQTIDNCEACKAPMDVSSVAPFTTVECPTCGAHSKVKVKFGPYTLARRHAIGGMSMVFSAFDSTLGREVAVKILSEEYSQDDTRIRAFEEEARITASFSHPNVVRVLRTGRAFGRFYIAMELVPGGHFEHHIREKGRIPEAEMLPLAIEVAQGLKAAKAAGLIHRDVKPGNILLDSEGHAKLVDFGLALVTQGGKARATELWATPFYVPPETVEGNEEDFRSDIYALGSTLYHALAGIPPCNEDTMATDRLLKAKREVIPLKEVAPDVSDMTCAIVDQAMAYDPDARFSSYDDLILCLRNAQALLRKGPYRIAPQQAPSRRGAAMWIVGSAIAAAMVSAYLFWPDDQIKPQPQPENPNPNTNITPVEGEDIIRTFGRARKELAEGQFQTAAEKFMRLNENPKVQEPSRSWAGVEAVLCLYLDGDVQGARKQAIVARQHLLDHPSTGQDGQVAITRDLADLLGRLDSLNAVDCPNNPKANSSEVVVCAMLAGLKNWQQGLLEPAAKCFQNVTSTKLSTQDQWLDTYQHYAKSHLDDYRILTGPLFSRLPASKEECERIISELNRHAPTIKTKGRAPYNLRAWQLDLARKIKVIEKR